MNGKSNQYCLQGESNVTESAFRKRLVKEPPGVDWLKAVVSINLVDNITVTKSIRVTCVKRSKVGI